MESRETEIVKRGPYPKIQLKNIKSIMRSYFFYIFLCGILNMACSSGSDDCEVGAIEHPNREGEELSGENYFDSATECRSSHLQTFQLPGNEIDTLFTDGGAVIVVPWLSFMGKDVAIEVLELYTPGDFIACQMTTDEKRDNDKLISLISEGALYINVVSDNQTTINEPIEVYIPSENQTPGLYAYSSSHCTDLDCDVLWEKEEQQDVYKASFRDEDGAETKGYQTLIEDSGWLNLASENPSSETSVEELYLMPPERFDEENSRVFFTYETSGTAVTTFSGFDDELHVFSPSEIAIPVGTKGHTVFVGMPEDEFEFALDTVKVQEGEVSLIRELSTGDEEQFKEAINKL